MIARVCAFLLLSATLFAQDAPFFGPPPNKEAPAPNVTPERLRDSSKEPQNWLTYSGGYASQRHSLLTTIRPTNARDLEL
jgi:glucose dehydrogenase